jgi:predicted alpha/beta hydrolase family esterase
MKKQIVFIHGGDTFNSYEEYIAFLKSFPIDIERFKPRRRWRDWLIAELGDDYECLTPDMPNKWNALYDEWKLWFEKIIPFLNEGVILIGHSLGGNFLAKYLAENDFPKKISKLFLLAAPFDAEGEDYSMASFALPKDLSRLGSSAEKIYIYQSQDDEVVAPANAQKYQQALPKAVLRIFPAYGHFSQETFPELFSDINSQ